MSFSNPAWDTINLWRSPSGQTIDTTGWARNTVEYNANLYGWQPASGAGQGGGGGGAGSAGSAGTDIEAQDRLLAYRLALGLTGQDYLNPAQRYKQSLYDPWEAAYGAQGRLNLGLGKAAPQYTSPGSFAGYAATNPSDAYANAAKILSQIFGLTSAQRGLTETTYEGDITSGGGSNAELQNLLRAGLQSRVGSGTAGWLAKQVPKEQANWWEQSTLGNTPLSFLDYFKQKWNF